MNEAEPKTYIARKSCGCVVAAWVNMPDHKRDVATFLSKMVREGLTVELVETERVRTTKSWLRRCPHDKPRRQRKAAI